VQTNSEETDRLQRVVARLVPTGPAGVDLLLIGGIRYRLLDNSQRFSVDIGYHWGGDLEAKQPELLALCRRVILGQVRRELGCEGSVSPAQRQVQAGARKTNFLSVMPARDRVTGPAQVVRQILFHLGCGLVGHRVQVLK